MMTSTKATFNINMEKYRLRRFVERLVDMDEVEIHDEPVPLTGLGSIIEKTEKAVLFKSVGPEKAEMVAKNAASRKRLIAAFETTEEKIYDEYFNRLANPKPVVEIPSSDAPVHTIQITGKDGGPIATAHLDVTQLMQDPELVAAAQALSLAATRQNAEAQTEQERTTHVLPPAADA